MWSNNWIDFHAWSRQDRFVLEVQSTDAGMLLTCMFASKYLHLALQNHKIIYFSTCGNCVPSAVMPYLGNARRKERESTSLPMWFKLVFWFNSTWVRSGSNFPPGAKCMCTATLAQPPPHELWSNFSLIWYCSCHGIFFRNKSGDENSGSYVVFWIICRKREGRFNQMHSHLTD